MRVLYGIQGTGHGHISRARELLPVLSEQAEVDVLISGYNCQLSLDGYRILRRRGVSFQYDSDGNVDVLATARELRPIRLMRDIQGLDLEPYDLVISDFEPVTAWAAALQGRRCVGLSHQAAFLSDKSPRPEKESIVAEQVMKFFAPSSQAIGFHFQRYDAFIEPPIIRKQVRDLNPTPGEHITVYLPAYHHDALKEVFAAHRQVQWQVFSPYCETPKEHGNVAVNPVSNERFLKSFEGCLGVVTSGGFETCAESMFMDKKLLVMPIRNQYEQLCNAAALAKLGIPVLQGWGEESTEKVDAWIRDPERVHLPEYADAGKVVRLALEHARQEKAA